MKKSIIPIYNSIFSFFYNKIVSDKFTSKSASLSIISLAIIGLLIFILNVFCTILIDYDFIKNSNIWLISIIIIVTYIITYKTIEKQI